MDTLWNTQVGGPDRLAVSYVFRATSSQIKSARFYMIPTGYSGYGAGTGGTIRVTIEADQNGSPSGTALASDNVPGTIDTNAVATFASAAAVTPGRLYHVVFRNVDANPTQNYASVDAAAWFGASTSQQRNPGWPNEEMRVLMSQNGGGWQERPPHADPEPDLRGRFSKRPGYMEVEVGHPAMISGTSSLVRERFTPGTARFVSEVDAGRPYVWLGRPRHVHPGHRRVHAPVRHGQRLVCAGSAIGGRQRRRLAERVVLHADARCRHDL